MPFYALDVATLPDPTLVNRIGVFLHMLKTCRVSVASSHDAAFYSLLREPSYIFKWEQHYSCTYICKRGFLLQLSNYSNSHKTGLGIIWALFCKWIVSKSLWPLFRISKNKLMLYYPQKEAHTNKLLVSDSFHCSIKYS